MKNLTIVPSAPPWWTNRQSPCSLANRSVGRQGYLVCYEHFPTKTRLTPPSWLYSVFPTWVSVGLPGVYGFHSGNDWECYKPIFVGDTITPECIFMGYEEKPSRFAGRTVIIHEEARYFNQRGALVAKAKTWSVRAERHKARSTGKYAQIQLPHP